MRPIFNLSNSLQDKEYEEYFNLVAIRKISFDDYSASKFAAMVFLNKGTFSWVTWYVTFEPLGLKSNKYEVCSNSVIRALIFSIDAKFKFLHL